MHKEPINNGKAVKEFRKERNITEEKPAERLISVSYLEKIEAGCKRPGMNTYQKLLDLLEADMVIHKKLETVQKKCAGKVQEILLGSTEAMAVFMADMVEAMVRNIKMVVM